MKELSKEQNKELEELTKTIDNIKTKYTYNYIAIGIGVIIILYGIFYFLSNPDIIGGVISIILIGGVVVAINIINLKQREKRVKELSIDLEKLKEVFYNEDN